MKCKDCKYCKCYGSGISGGFKCTHENIYKSARMHENRAGKRINKSVEHIGYKMIKTSMKHCPLKQDKEG